RATAALRGELVIGPVTDRSIFRLQGERIAAIQRKFGDVPWLVMTSRAVHDRTVALFKRENSFGASASQVWFFCQELLPVLDARGNPARDEAGEWILAPAGHGGLVSTLAGSGLIETLIARGVEHLFYFQYPNVLERICDPVLLGHHDQGGHDATMQAIVE